LAAEAQISVTPTGPTALHVTDTTSTYTATITTNYTFTFYLFVFNGNTQVYLNSWYVVQTGPSYNFQSPALSTSTWGLAVGNQMDYRGRAMLSARVGAQTEWYVTVTNPTSMAPGGGFATDLAEALPPERKRLSALLEALAPGSEA
jgi:hypothetical protein